ncbi:Dcp1p-Dcp2p decapping enzyme complex alpha subunit [Rhizophlyctis rosea]|uniref:Dcp1p-Dcp2p decapping enzyme complex alpha subunit n=1 Tax=Rhizophlyctis rosea TaxID=64517 RepID=A0AAD5SIX0_9FUNG|nr:Dcp1p-Dcp2p decapping enzyme complex alpha subunit [Rhizophlyctis rosea]
MSTSRNGNRDPQTWDQFKAQMGWRDDPVDRPKEVPPSPTHEGISHGPERELHIPLADEPVIVTCKACNRAMVQTAFADHAEHCRTLNSEKWANIRQENSTATNKKRKKPEDASDSQGPSSGFLERPEKQQKFGKTPGKAKAPFDLDKNCGVPLDNGHPCTRSITCKIHPVSAKRAVPGRTMQYDMLVGEYQAVRGGPMKPGARGPANARPGPPQLNAGPPLSQEDEVNAVLKSVREHRPVPLALPAPCATYSQWSVWRNRLMLRSIFGGRRGDVA